MDTEAYRLSKIEHLNQLVEDELHKLLYDLEELHYHYLYNIILKRGSSDAIVFVTEQTTKLQEGWSKKLSKVELIKLTSDLIEDSYNYIKEHSIYTH